MAAKNMKYTKKLEAKLEDSQGKIYFFKLSGIKNLAYGISSTLRKEIEIFVSEDFKLKELGFLLGCSNSGLSFALSNCSVKSANQEPHKRTRATVAVCAVSPLLE